MGYYAITAAEASLRWEKQSENAIKFTGHIAGSPTNTLEGREILAAVRLTPKTVLRDCHVSLCLIQRKVLAC
jgi:hypothetical protein